VSITEFTIGGAADQIQISPGFQRMAVPVGEPGTASNYTYAKPFVFGTNAARNT
jgi:hypothetical protein